jgi:Phage integrase family
MRTHSSAWNKSRLLGQKPPLKPREIWSIRIRLQLANKTRDLALFDLALDSKLRGCDLCSLRVRDVSLGGTVASRAIAMQRKTQRPVQFEITEHTRDALGAWIKNRHLRAGDYLFPGRRLGAQLSLRQYARIVKAWTASVGLDLPGMARIPLDAQSPLSSTSVPRTSGPSSCSSGIPSWKARFGISELRLTTLSRFPSRWKSRLLRATSGTPRSSASAQRPASAPQPVRRDVAD